MSLKRDIFHEGLVENWRDVLDELDPAVEEISTLGSDIVPRVSYGDIEKGLSKEQISRIRRVGTVVITDGVPKEEALRWKQEIKDYAARNAGHVKGFPPENIQIFEIYNSKPQIQARTHPSILSTHRFLLSLWHISNPNTPISLDTPLSYFDRLRIRQPGDAKFTLGPHVDGGSVERWEDPGYREVWRRILGGGGVWRSHDPFDASGRVEAKLDLYHASNACSVFRAWQGWTSLSSTGPNEGTLRVLPMLSLSTAYTILRPFFRPKNPHSTSLKFEDWEVDLDGPRFPGSSIGKTQELNERTHPHLKLGRTMVSVPRVEPGDQVYWHCDVVHAVEAQHRGLGDSSVLYIPAVPLTIHNASYLRDQRLNFLSGHPPPDFPGGEGESKFIGRGTLADVSSPEGCRTFGFEEFTTNEGGLKAEFVERANRALALE